MRNDRRSRSLLRPLAALLPLLGVVWLAGCAPDESAINVSLANLAATPATYEGRLVAVDGVVATFEDPRHYWIEDDHLNRLALLPDELVADHVGDFVRVTGEFRREERGGRQLMVRDVTPIPPPPAD